MKLLVVAIVSTVLATAGTAAAAKLLGEKHAIPQAALFQPGQASEVHSDVGKRIQDKRTTVIKRGLTRGAYVILATASIAQRFDEPDAGAVHCLLIGPNEFRSHHVDVGTDGIGLSESERMTFQMLVNVPAGTTSSVELTCDADPGKGGRAIAGNSSIIVLGVDAATSTRVG